MLGVKKPPETQLGVLVLWWQPQTDRALASLGGGIATTSYAALKDVNIKENAANNPPWFFEMARPATGPVIIPFADVIRVVLKAMPHDEADIKEFARGATTDSAMAGSDE